MSVFALIKLVNKCDASGLSSWICHFMHCKSYCGLHYVWPLNGIPIIQFNKKGCICNLQLWDVLACWSWNCIQLWAEARRPFKVFPINSPFYLMVFRRISIMAKYLSFSTENWIIKLFSEIKVEINFVAVRCRKYWTWWREN